MRRGAVVLSSVLAAVVSAAAATAATSGPVHVSPGRGGPRSTFTVSVTLPTSTGSFTGIRRIDALSVSGPRRPGCVASAEMTLPAGAAGSVVRERLVPARLGGRWCAGTFTGVVAESQQGTCGPPLEATLCPQIVIAPQTIGRFRFRVR